MHVVKDDLDVGSGDQVGGTEIAMLLTHSMAIQLGNKWSATQEWWFLVALVVAPRQQDSGYDRIVVKFGAGVGDDPSLKGWIMDSITGSQGQMATDTADLKLTENSLAVQQPVKTPRKIARQTPRVGLRSWRSMRRARSVARRYHAMEDNSLDLESFSCRSLGGALSRRRWLGFVVSSPCVSTVARHESVNSGSKCS